MDYVKARYSGSGIKGTTNRLGNAIYRDGVNYYFGTDWHTGLVAHPNGPQVTGNNIIHHPGMNDIVKYDSYANFLNGNTFMDEYYMSTVSLYTYTNIFSTAHSLTNEGISYSLLNALKTSKTNGSIDPSDITKLRCDGVVEYCYERNGVRLMGPTSPTNAWNISMVIGANYHPNGYGPMTQATFFDGIYVGLGS